KDPECAERTDEHVAHVRVVVGADRVFDLVPRQPPVSGDEYERQQHGDDTDDLPKQGVRRVGKVRTALLRQVGHLAPRWVTGFANGTSRTGTAGGYHARRAIVMISGLESVNGSRPQSPNCASITRPASRRNDDSDCASRNLRVLRLTCG